MTEPVSDAEEQPAREEHPTRDVLSANLRRLRALKHLSQEDLALEADLHRTFVAHVERGARNISIDNIEKLANALGVPVHELLRPSSTMIDMQTGESIE